jgi:hypothetical protein
MRKFNRAEHGLLPLGRVNLQASLTIDQLVKLDRLARKWECDNLSEAAIEILRDVIEETA